MPAFYNTDTSTHTFTHVHTHTHMIYLPLLFRTPHRYVLDFCLYNLHQFKFVHNIFIFCIWFFVIYFAYFADEWNKYLRTYIYSTHLYNDKMTIIMFLLIYFICIWYFGLLVFHFVCFSLLFSNVCCGWKSFIYFLNIICSIDQITPLRFTKKTTLKKTTIVQTICQLQVSFQCYSNCRTVWQPH